MLIISIFKSFNSFNIRSKPFLSETEDETTIAKKYYYNNKNFDESFIDNKPSMLTLLGKWNDHYRSWTRNKTNL